MYAVIKAGGKQQKVKPGDVIEIELARHDGESITFNPILIVDDEGRSHFGKELGKAVVKAKLVGEGKGEKVKIFKYRPKTGYQRRQGHRQMHTLVEILDVSLGKRPATKSDRAAEKAPSEEEAGAPTPSTRSRSRKPPAGEAPVVEGENEEEGA
jgi:large subunit ribosomal protein L21